MESKTVSRTQLDIFKSFCESMKFQFHMRWSANERGMVIVCDVWDYISKYSVISEATWVADKDIANAKELIATIILDSLGYSEKATASEDNEGSIGELEDIADDISSNFQSLITKGITVMTDVLNNTLNGACDPNSVSATS